MTGFLFVGLGGAIGAMLRYTISLLPYKGTFPVLTFVTNILGAIFIGMVVGMATKKQLSPNAVLFLKTGVCGGFTTFSTFSLEAHQLYQAGNYGYSATYMIASVLFCFVGIAVGTKIAELI